MSTTIDSIGPGKGLPCLTPYECIERIPQLNEDLGRFSTFSTAVYDTAWLSMVYKSKGDISPLFPGCFEHLLETQREDGS
jgi:hypothetical protein